jgi:CheY-like chemotaxis protein
MSLKVLTVDDSKTIRMVVKRAFKDYDVELHEGENGVEGLAMASKIKPDLIVLDITMPVMSGIEMLEKLKGEASLKDIPVIMLTAESGKDNVMKIVKMGVSDYMVKPFKGDQLIERVEKIVKLQSKQEDEGTVGGGAKYFELDQDVQLLNVPDKVGRPVVVEIEGLLTAKIKEMTAAGVKKLVLNLGKCSQTNMSLIKLIVLVAQRCQTAGINFRVAGQQSLGSELKGFQETSAIAFDPSIDQAKAALA